jgi:hypothetical protein
MLVVFTQDNLSFACAVDLEKADAPGTGVL